MAERQIAVAQNGRTVLVYVDLGKAKALVGHGRPTGWCPGGVRQLKSLGGNA